VTADVQQRLLAHAARKHGRRAGSAYMRRRLAS
jgi:hypothetical protein